MTGIDLDAIEARASAATEGPWLADEGVFVLKPDRPGFAYDGTIIARVFRDDFGLVEEADTEFIAAARTDVPALVARVRGLEAQRDAALAIHERRESSGEDIYDYCSECYNDVWPCPTVQALAPEGRG